MNSVAHLALMVVIVAGVAGALALASVAEGPAFAGEPQAALIAQATTREASPLAATPFQAIPPLLETPPVAAAVPYEYELIEADPERKKNRARRIDWLDRLEDFERVDRNRAERFEGVERLERFEPAVGVIRLDRVERPEKVEKVERLERVEKIEKIEKVERRERLERPERRRGRD